MVHITASALIVAALSIGDAMAGPTHMHLHQRAHEQRGVDYSTIDYSKLNVDWAAAYAAGQASKSAAAAVVPTPAATSVSGGVFAAKASNVASKVSSVVAAATSAAGKSSGSSTGLLNGVVGFSNDLTSFGESSTTAYQVGDSAVNNVGVPYGSNVIKVASTDGYDFTNTFVNTQSQAITINIWNKVGKANGNADVSQSGSTDAPKQTTLTFVLAAGASQTVAIMENSNIGWAQACTKLRSDSGSFDTSFGEATFLKKGSGYNLSAIPNTAGNTYSMSISSVEAPACTSDPTQNYWLTPTEPIGTSDGSCYIAQSTAHLTTKMGGNM